MIHIEHFSWFHGCLPLGVSWAVYSKLSWQRPLLGWVWLWSSSFTHCWKFSMAVAMQPGNALPSPRRTFGSSTFQVLTPVPFWLWCVNPSLLSLISQMSYPQRMGVSSEGRPGCSLKRETEAGQSRKWPGSLKSLWVSPLQKSVKG